MRPNSSALPPDDELQLEKVASQVIEQPGTQQPESVAKDAPPDGGLHAWLSVLGTGLVLFNAWGLVQAFGAYQSYYTTNTLQDYNASQISWIGTIQAFLLVFVGVLTGPIFDQGHLRTLMFIGCTMMVFGVMMLSLSTKYYQILLAQAICVGLGSGMIFTPALAQVTISFSKRRPVALALTTAGVGLGGIIYPIVFDQLEPRIGFAWATRVIGFISLGTLLTATTILAWKKPPRRPPRSLFDITALKEGSFIFYTLAIFVMFTAYWVPWFYIPLYGKFGVGAGSFSFYLLSITNACSIVGRLSASVFQRWFNSLRLLVGASILAGILVWAWISIHEFGSFVVFCVFWVSNQVPIPLVNELTSDRVSSLARWPYYQHLLLQN